MTAVNLNDLRAQVEILRFVRRKKAELKELEDNARGAIEEVLGDDEAGELDGRPVIKWSMFKKRQLDQKALREAHPDLVESYTKLNEVRRFEVIDEPG